MNKREQKSFDRMWTRMVNGGIPLDGGFETNVVKAHAEIAFKAGIHFAKQNADDATIKNKRKEKSMT